MSKPLGTHQPIQLRNNNWTHWFEAQENKTQFYSYVFEKVTYK
jgi:hypothetical protein